MFNLTKTALGASSRLATVNSRLVFKAEASNLPINNANFRIYFLSLLSSFQRASFFTAVFLAIASKCFRLITNFFRLYNLYFLRLLCSFCFVARYFARRQLLRLLPKVRQESYYRSGTRLGASAGNSLQYFKFEFCFAATSDFALRLAHTTPPRPSVPRRLSGEGRRIYMIIFATVNNQPIIFCEPKFTLAFQGLEDEVAIRRRGRATLVLRSLLT